MKNTRDSTILYLMIGIQAAVGILIGEPENTVAVLDAATTIRCRSNESVNLIWHSFASGLEEVQLYSGYGSNVNPLACPNSLCKVENPNPGEYNLIITARKETAKHYRCTEPVTLNKPSASFIVIESKLTCTCKATSSDTKLSCAIRFYGEWRPQIKWKRSDGEQVNNGDVVVHTDNGTVTSTLTTQETPIDACGGDDTTTSTTTNPSPPIEGDTTPRPTTKFTFIASVYFNENDRPTAVTATNIPNYADEWMSPQFNSEVKETGTGTNTGVIAGAVIGTAAATAAIGGGVYYVYKKKHSSGTEKVNQPMITA